MDIMTDLPDSLLLHIFSFLDTKQLVQTSCLSKKWIDFWKSAPDLNFDFAYNVDENKVMNLLHYVLHGRYDSRIRKLQLSRLRFSTTSKLTRWLTFALERHVEEVHLDSIVYSKIYWELPHFLFTSTVKVLKYKEEYPVTVALKLPNSILKATQLTTLSLQYVRLVPSDSNGELILSCPVLETLSLKYCPHHLRMLNISAARLKRLKIYGYRLIDYTKHHKIKICTPNLISLDLVHPYYNDFYLEDLPSISS
ncbi:F-box protein [Thalictrum thalictroides]|uniref:F-box protein n=1 Tax=Thalictrum thalictroides TaxID=46969 RepID=A0A7J6WC99_THATH|nr:F-box protein [Thalictrum thalictroides]